MIYWNKTRTRRLIEEYRAGVPIERLAMKFSRTPSGIKRKLRKELGLPQEPRTLKEKIKPFVLKDLTIREIHKKLPDIHYQSIARAASKVRKDLGLPQAWVRSGKPLKLTTEVRIRLKAEATARGYETSSELADKLLEIIIVDRMIDAILDGEQKRAAA